LILLYFSWEILSEKSGKNETRGGCNVQPWQVANKKYNDKQKIDNCDCLVFWRSVLAQGPSYECFKRILCWLFVGIYLTLLWCIQTFLNSFLDVPSPHTHLVVKEFGKWPMGFNIILNTWINLSTNNVHQVNTLQIAIWNKQKNKIFLSCRDLNLGPQRWNSILANSATLSHYTIKLFTP
jgi:hypothetical protein